MQASNSLPDAATLFLAAYSADGAASVEQALHESGSVAADFAGWCRLPAFRDRLHSMLSSLEAAAPLDPFALPPLPPVTCTVEGVRFAIDPLGPLHRGYAYDHAAHAFANGVKVSEVAPADIEWFNAAASWPRE